MSEVFLCRKGSIDQRSRTALRKAGVVVVEADDPSQCQFIRAGELISHDDMLWACLDALNAKGNYGEEGRFQRERLAANLLLVVAANRVEARQEEGESHE